ncbi:MAG TPA: alkaline phosphatase family protein [Terriglobales bacterium]|nr:alkaline phosphatase family protein [Terriglobales bacterium]
MKLRSPFLPFLLIFCLLSHAFPSAYQNRPKLIVVIIIDQFRADYLERYYDRFGEGGFRLLMDHGANFSDCHYDYANTHTAPGHATLFTGAYSDGHGIGGNEWWDPALRKVVTSVEDSRYQTLKPGGSNETGVSPHNLLADTIGDELRLATAGKSRVFGISFKDRAAVLPAGYSGNAAYWIDHDDGGWETSSYYMKSLPQWVVSFVASGPTKKYLNREWNGADGSVLDTTAPATNAAGQPVGFYDLVGKTPFANDYEFDFAKELIRQEKLGGGPTTDLLSISLSANDILGHRVGPDSPKMAAMAVALDRQFADFFAFLQQQLGKENVWVALSADHGIAPVVEQAQAIHVPASRLDSAGMAQQINLKLAQRFPQFTGGPRCLRPEDARRTHRENTPDFVAAMSWPIAYLCKDDFDALKIGEAEAEQMVGDVFKLTAGLRAAYTRAQLTAGDVPQSSYGQQYLHSRAEYGGWYVIGELAPFVVGTASGTDHSTSYNYDTHVPLAFYGAPFKPGTYRSHSEPVDMVATFSALLGIERPSHSIGRVLTEALAPQR